MQTPYSRESLKVRRPWPRLPSDGFDYRSVEESSSAPESITGSSGQSSRAGEPCYPLESIGFSTRTLLLHSHVGEHGYPARQQSMDTPANVGCPVARTAEIIGNKWTPLIVRDLARERRRFSELERSLVGISPKTLSERLKRLEEAGVVTRNCFAEVPPRVEYALTAKGYALLPVIESMRVFGAEWLDDAPCEAEPSIADDLLQRRPTPALLSRS